MTFPGGPTPSPTPVPTKPAAFTLQQWRRWPGSPTPCAASPPIGRRWTQQQSGPPCRARASTCPEWSCRTHPFWGRPVWGSSPWGLLRNKTRVQWRANTPPTAVPWEQRDWFIPVSSPAFSLLQCWNTKDLFTLVLPGSLYLSTVFWVKACYWWKAC